MSHSLLSGRKAWTEVGKLAPGPVAREMLQGYRPLTFRKWSVHPDVAGPMGQTVRWLLLHQTLQPPLYLLSLDSGCLALPSTDSLSPTLGCHFSLASLAMDQT